MPLPNDNRHFQRGDFDGYATHGKCKIAESFKTLHRNHTFQPVRGKFFAQLDDPLDITPKGVRKPGGVPPANLSHLTIKPDSAGRITRGVDGSVLECPNVTIKSGQALWFHWAFARFDSPPYNDFAMFAAYLPGDVDFVNPVFDTCLVQSLVLESQARSYTDWQAYSWRPEKEFFGTLRWIVANGISTTNGSTVGGSARPSALLIDCIELE